MGLRGKLRGRVWFGWGCLITVQVARVKRLFEIRMTCPCLSQGSVRWQGSF
jgi:hypothetical protein